MKVARYKKKASLSFIAIALAFRLLQVLRFVPLINVSTANMNLFCWHITDRIVASSSPQKLYMGTLYGVERSDICCCDVPETFT